MLKIPKKVEYGLIALVHLGSEPESGPVSRIDLAQANQVPVDLLGKVLQALTRSGLLQSVQGNQGGYLLARPIEEIRMGEVVEAIEGPFHMVECTSGNKTCAQYDKCRIVGTMLRMEEHLRDYFFGLPIGEFLEPEPAPLPVVCQEDRS